MGFLFHLNFQLIFYNLPNSKTQYEKTGGTYYIEFSEDGYLPKTEKKKWAKHFIIL